MINKSQSNDADLEKIYSHPQALVESFHYLNAHYKNIAKQDFSSTAAPAKHVSENPDRKLAAVANQFAAKLYDLENIDRKSGLLVSLPEDHAGGLHQVLSIFAWRHINLS